ncbi:MAG: ACT domain-containing protein [Elusimicrobia bacterium]|nr:ACT domain-containing protein [Elusimicrobiota bacterium]
MEIKQISIFLENKKGRLAAITNVLADNNINIRALSLADTKEFGVLRIVVNEHTKCLNALKINGYAAQETYVIAVEVPDSPGGLCGILKLLEDNDHNVEYMYAMVEKNRNNAVVIFKIGDFKKAIELLKSNNVSIVNASVLKNL